jgi:hypothetical protein
MEKAGLDMMRQDGQSLMVHFYANKWKLLTEEIFHLSSFESSLNSHFHKQYLRLTGYPRSLIDVLHERPSTDQGDQQAEYIWKIQTNLVSILSGKKHTLQTISLPEDLSHCPLPTLLILLQYTETIFSKDFNSVMKIKELIGDYFLFCHRILQRLDILISTHHELGGGWDDHTGHSTHLTMISILLTQCFRTMRVILTNDCPYRKNRSYPPTEYLKYNTEICDIFIRWIDIITWNRQHPHPTATTTTAISSSSSSTYSSLLLAKGYAHFSNHLICDLFICSKCVLHLLLSDSCVTTLKHGLYSKSFGYSYQVLVDKLIRSLIPLSQILLTNLSSFSDITRRVSIGDIRLMESIQAEYVACLTCVSVIFTMGSLNHSLLQLLHSAQKIALDFRASMSVQTVWFQTLLSAILCLNMICGEGGSGTSNDVNLVTNRITEAKLLDLRNKISSKRDKGSGEGGGRDETSSSSALNSLPLTDQYYIFFGSTIQSLVKLLAHHISSPSIQHIGLLIIRLILRCPFMSKKEIEIFLEGNPLTQQEMNDQKKLMAKELKDRYKSTSSMVQKERVVIPFTGEEGENNGAETLVDVNALLEGQSGGGEDDDEISLESISDWKEKTWSDDNVLLDDDEDQLLVNDLGATHEQVLAHGQGGHGGLYYRPAPQYTDNIVSNKYDIKKKTKNDAHNNSNSTSNNVTTSTSSGTISSSVDKNHLFLYRTLQELTLSDLLKLVGERNMQSKETMEQWLLLIYHIANGTPLARQTLVNAYVDESLQKLHSIQVSDIYMIALCEMSLQILQHHDAG